MPELELAVLAERGRADQEERAAEAHLVDRRDERVRGERDALRHERAERPAHRRADHHREPERRRAGAQAGSDDEAEADEPGQRAEAGRPGRALARRSRRSTMICSGTVPGDHRGDARVDSRLGDVNEPDAEPEQQRADERGRGELAARDPQRGPAPGAGSRRGGAPRRRSGTPLRGAAESCRPRS